MEHLLNAEQLALAHTSLLASDSEQLVDVVFRLALRRPVTEADSAGLALAARNGWIDPRTHAFTPVGALVADSIREYRFWQDRGGKTHAQDHSSLFAPESYEGKSVLEPGSGFGCNLLSLSRVAGRFVGLEPVAVYRQLTPILARREGLAPPEVVGGRCEELPFADGEFDIVLCYSAHQYMDVKPALREMARVLKPGGQVQIIGGTLDVFIADQGPRVARQRSLGALKNYLLTIGNTLSYAWLGRRLHVPMGSAATTAPIYPGYRLMSRWLQDVGLRMRHDLTRRIDVETCFIADKPVATSGRLVASQARG